MCVNGHASARLRRLDLYGKDGELEQPALFEMDPI